MSGKSRLRFEAKAALASLTVTVKAGASAALCDQLQSTPAFRGASRIAIFHPTDAEPDLLPLLGLPDKTFVFPRCHPDRSLTWHRPDRRQLWQINRFGIREPDPALDREVPMEAIDLVLVPGLAFTSSGDRLGHGAGYYDRFLATLPVTTPTIGICFSCQLLPSLSVEAHDVPVGTVLYA